MISRLRRYFRSGHIAMSPMPSLSFFGWMHSSPVAPTTYPINSDAQHLRHSYNGSAAIAMVVAQMQLDKDDKVLLPAYCCGAELGPFQNAGCRIYFYDTTHDLGIDHDQITATLEEHPDCRVLFVTHYFGMLQPDLASLAVLCKARGVCLVEDCAHALYSYPHINQSGLIGDYAIFSQRKFVPVTEGGLLVSKQPLEEVGRSIRKRAPIFARLNRLTYSIAQRQRCRIADSSVFEHARAVLIIAMMMIPTFVLKTIRRSHLLPAQHWLSPEVEGMDAVPVYNYGLSQRAWAGLLNTDATQIINKRRENFQFWLETLEISDTVRPLIAALPKDMCPLYFPVVVSSPANVVDALANNDIEAFNWWHRIPEELQTQGEQCFPIAMALKKQVVALPVHQQITRNHIIRMNNVLREILADSTVQASQSIQP